MSVDFQFLLFTALSIPFVKKRAESAFAQQSPLALLLLQQGAALCGEVQIQMYPLFQHKWDGYLPGGLDATSRGAVTFTVLHQGRQNPTRNNWTPCCQYWRVNKQMPGTTSTEGRALRRAGHRSLMTESGNFWKSWAALELPTVMWPIAAPQRKYCQGLFHLLKPIE